MAGTRANWDGLRAVAAERLAALGPPDNRDEDWRYLALANWADFAPAPSLTAPADLGFEAGLHLIDGAVVTAHLPAGWRRDDPTPRHLAAWQARLVSAERDELAALARCQAPLLLHAGRGADLPLVLRHTVGGGAPALHLSVEVDAGASAHLVLIHAHQAPADLATLVEAVLDDGARLTIDEVELGLPGPTAIGRHLACRRLAPGRDAVLTWTLATPGGRWVRHAWHADLEQPGAEATLAGTAIVGGERQAHALLRVVHRAGHCVSRQRFVHVADDRARVGFDGLVTIPPGATGSEAQQLNRNLQLSPRAQVFSRPQLDIRHDEVQASHGAAVGQPDDDEVHYLRTRGLDPAQARHLLVRGFARDGLERLVHPAARALAERHLLAQLDHGSRP